MRTFRQKILVTYFILLLLFLALLFPFVTNSVEEIVYRSMSDRADELIGKLKDSADTEDLLRTLREHKHQLFYRIAILDGERRLLYDSHAKRLVGPLFFPLQFATHPEVEEALKNGTGYAEQYSYLLDQKLTYVAKVFTAHGKRYVLRLAFPYQYIHDLAHDFEIGFLFISTIVLVLFSAMVALVLNHFSSPIREIVRSITPYSLAEGAAIPPKICLNTSPNDEFGLLANTLNSLSDRVQKEMTLLSDERNERDAVLESLAEGVIAVDADRVISYANNLALDLLNLPKEVIGTPLPDTIPEAIKRLIDHSLVQKKVRYDEIKIAHKQKGLLHLNLIASPRTAEEINFHSIPLHAIPPHPIPGVILVLQDRTIHYRLLQMRKDFIANASHELKTPITVIRGFAETLHDHQTLPADTVQQITGKIVRNCDRMAKTVHNLLALADIERLPTSRLMHVSLLSILEGAVHNLQSIHPDAQCTIHIQNPQDSYELTCDPDLIETAINNLLDNAAKYSSSPAHITIKLTRGDESIELQIIDKGIGIPAAEIEQIFQRFYRVNKAQSNRIGGSGLGLSIVETIVHKHGGSIAVSSELNQGSTFTIILPLQNKN